MKFPKLTIQNICLSLVGAYIFLVPLFYYPPFIHSVVQGKELLLKVTLLVLLTIIAGAIAAKKRLINAAIFDNRLFLLLFAILGSSLISAAFSPTPIVALYGTFSRGFGGIIEIFLFILLVICASIRGEKSLEKLVVTAWGSGLLVALYGVLQKVGFDPLFSNLNTNIFAGRIFSTLGNPGYLGQYLLLTFCMGVYLWYRNYNKKIVGLYAPGTILMLVTMLLSQTRAAVLGLIIGVVIMLIRYRVVLIKQMTALAQNLQKTARVTVVVSIIVISVSGFFAAHKLLGDRFSFSKDSFRSVFSRIEIWKGAVKKIAQRPLLGYGPETFYLYSPEMVTKEFLTLEEDISISADRAHNEFLQTFFDRGVIGVILYLVLFGALLKIVLSTKDELSMLLAFIPLITTIQNQFAFNDITIASLLALCLGGLVGLTSLETQQKEITWPLWTRLTFFYVSLFVILAIGYATIYKTYRAHEAYTTYIEQSPVSYEAAITALKTTTTYTPYYSQPWYELMIVDSSSQPRALTALTAIEGDSGNVLAWKGNLYGPTDPDTASEYYVKALEKNPYHPDWIRSFADMLYKQGDHETALFMYERYLEAVPEFYTWKDSLSTRTPKERQSYEVFFKHAPYFWLTYARIEELRKEIQLQ